MLEIIVVFIGVLADQLTKLWAADALAGGNAITLIPGVIELKYTENTGAAFGMFGQATWVLAVLSAVLSIVLAVIIARYRKKYTRFPMIALSLILAGAIGNMIDRIFAGYVVDFCNFTFMHFAVFNVADALISVGAVLLVLYLLLSARGKKEGEVCQTNEMVQECPAEHASSQEEQPMEAPEAKNSGEEPGSRE